MVEQMDLAGKLWDLENYVTAFAIAQSLAVTFGIAKKELRLIDSRKAHMISIASTLLFLGLYSAAIFWCGFTGAKLQPDADRHIWHVVTWSEFGAVCLFTGVVVITLIGNMRAITSSQSSGDSSTK